MSLEDSAFATQMRRSPGSTIKTIKRIYTSTGSWIQAFQYLEKMNRKVITMRIILTGHTKEKYRCIKLLLKV